MKGLMALSPTLQQLICCGDAALSHGVLKVSIPARPMKCRASARPNLIRGGAALAMGSEALPKRVR
jgi:hypothetical protein